MLLCILLLTFKTTQLSCLPACLVHCMWEAVHCSQKSCRTISPPQSVTPAPPPPPPPPTNDLAHLVVQLGDLYNLNGCLMKRHASVIYELRIAIYKKEIGSELQCFAQQTFKIESIRKHCVKILSNLHISMQ